MAWASPSTLCSGRRASLDDVMSVLSVAFQDSGICQPLSRFSSSPLGVRWMWIASSPAAPPSLRQYPWSPLCPSQFSGHCTRHVPQPQIFQGSRGGKHLGVPWSSCRGFSGFLRCTLFHNCMWSCTSCRLSMCQEVGLSPGSATMDLSHSSASFLKFWKELFMTISFHLSPVTFPHIS